MASNPWTTIQESSTHGLEAAVPFTRPVGQSVFTVVGGSPETTWGHASFSIYLNPIYRAHHQNTVMLDARNGMWAKRPLLPSPTPVSAPCGHQEEIQMQVRIIRARQAGRQANGPYKYKRFICCSSPSCSLLRSRTGPESVVVILFTVHHPSFCHILGLQSKSVLYISRPGNHLTSQVVHTPPQQP